MRVAVISENKKVRIHLRTLASFLNHKVYGFSDVLRMVESTSKNKEKIDSVLFHLGDVFNKTAFKALLFTIDMYKGSNIIVISNSSLASMKDYRFESSLMDMGVTANLYENDSNFDSKLTDILKAQKRYSKRPNPFKLLIIASVVLLSISLSTPLVFINVQSNTLTDKIYREARSKVIQDYLQTKGFFEGEETTRGGKVVIIENQDTLRVTLKNEYGTSPY